MKPCIVALVIVSALVFMSSCSQPANETSSNVPVATPTTKAVATPDEFAVARATFLKNCSGCHGEDGTGGTKTVDGKKLKVPSYHEGHALTHKDEDFIKQITNGGDGMPAFKEKLSPEEMNDLVRFIRKVIQSSGH